MKKVKTLAFVFFFFFSTSVIVAHNDSLSSDEERLKIQEGTASYYGKRFHNRKTANGEIFNMTELTAAHKHLPFGTMLKVTNLKNGREVWVRINDRLPQSSKRVIDLSRGAAEELEMVRDGITQVRIEVAQEEVIFQLMEYFQDHKPEDLRLRPYEKPIETGSERPLIYKTPLIIYPLETVSANLFKKQS
jgi:rare lipoprotein A